MSAACGCPTLSISWLVSCADFKRSCCIPDTSIIAAMPSFQWRVSAQFLRDAA